jgi:glyoxylase-like metal-dependent hydrolase (beta-lactamase superfamily II)
MKYTLQAALLASLAIVPAAARDIAMRVFEINDHVLAYYDGRPAESATDPADQSWAATGAYNVGVCTYVIHQGHEALVYDTYPDTEDAQWVRHDLARRGISHFTVVNSHWHLDHVGGNAVYADADRIATQRTIAILRSKQTAIEAGTEWGLPAIRPLVMPNIGVSRDTQVWIGNIKVMLRPVDIHSADGLVALIPGDGILLAGDTLEDTVTFVSEPEHISGHIEHLEGMRHWNIRRILPNHGDPGQIAAGGYAPTLIDATLAYLRKLRARAGEAHDQTGSLEDYVGDSVARGWVSVWWAYRAAHAENMKRMAAVVRVATPPASLPPPGQ